MKKFLPGAVLVAGLAFAVPAFAAPGQCEMTGFDSFECDVDVDGGGITFALPDGQIFVFSHVADGEGLGYLIPADATPGRYPEELGAFRPAEGEDGCWVSADDETKFCAALIQ